MNNTKGAPQNPPLPTKPEQNECCGSGCNPCIFDYYYSALEKWTKKYADTDQSKPNRN